MRQKTFVQAVIYILLLLWPFQSVGFQGGQDGKPFLDSKMSKPALQESSQIRTRISYRNGSIHIIADKSVSEDHMFYAAGKVQIVLENIAVTGDAAEYDLNTQALTVSGQTTMRIPYRDGVILINADKTKTESAGQTLNAYGKVQIAVEHMAITCDAAAYDPTTKYLRITGHPMTITDGQSRTIGSHGVMRLDQMSPKLSIKK